MYAESMASLFDSAGSYDKRIIYREYFELAFQIFAQAAAAATSLSWVIQMRLLLNL